MVEHIIKISSKKGKNICDKILKLEQSKTDY
jgi:hypothetical protein